MSKLRRLQIVTKNTKNTSRNKFLLASHAWKHPSNSRSVAEKAKKYGVLFLETSSMHGLKYLIVGGRHSFEMLIWLLIVAISLCGSVHLSWATWIRYQNSPTVISMDRDMFSWNTSFPAATICLDTKIDSEKLSELLQNTTDSDKDAVYLFIKSLSNATFDNFDKIPKYNSIPPEKYLELLLSLMPGFRIITIDVSGINLQVVPTVTEMGLCYAINSKVAVYNSPEYIAANRWDVVRAKEPVLYINPLDGEVLAQIVKLPSSYKAYIHGPFEVPDVSTRFYRSEKKFYLKLHVTATAVYTSPEAAKLAVGQRRCRFLHENNLQHSSVYTYTMCRMECRIRLCLQYCQCIPFFYRKRGDQKICDVKGMHCLAKHKDKLNTLRDNKGKKILCDCYPICDDVNYVIQLSELQKWMMDTNFQWGIVTFPRLRYRRDIIFRFTDVLVAIGGMAGLFLGCSLLSFLEIIYFITLRLFFYSYSPEKKVNVVM